MVTKLSDRSGTVLPRRRRDRGTCMGARLTRNQWSLLACESQTDPTPHSGQYKLGFGDMWVKEPHEGDTELPVNQANGELSQFSLWEEFSKDKITLHPNLAGQSYLLRYHLNPEISLHWGNMSCLSSDF